MKNVVLIGMPGSGKSFIGYQIAVQLDYEFFDSDRWISEWKGQSIPEIFENEGEASFREFESKCLDYLLEVPGPMVISTGGGMPAIPNAMERLKKLGLVIFMNTDLNVLIERTKKAKHRPLLHHENPEQKLRQIYEERLPIYQQADFEFHTGKTINPVDDLQRLIELNIKGKS